MNNELTMELLMKALSNSPEMCVDLVLERLYYYVEMTDELYYLENCDDNIDLIADSRDLTTKDMIILGMNNDYDPRADYVNSDLETISTNQLAELYITHMEYIWGELLSDEDKEEIANELTELSKDNIIQHTVAPSDSYDCLVIDYSLDSYKCYQELYIN